MFELSVGLDLFPVLAAVFASVSCGLLGNFLVLRRQSLMGDAISHSVLPGLVIAFLVGSTRDPVVMLLGASVAGVATVVLVEVVTKVGRVEAGAAMGVVFSVFFALGVLLIERAAARHVDLDADCVLYGQLETLVWYGAPERIAGVFRWETLGAVPRQMWVLAGTLVASVLFVGGLFKELRISAFDPALATAQGFSATGMHYALMVLVAVATVASFEAVGSILVIAMLVCPAATARLLTDRLGRQVWLSVVVSVLCGAGGYLSATVVPGVFGLDSVNAAGSMAVVAGVLLCVALVAGPRHGVVMRSLRRRRLARRALLDDLLGALFRVDERGGGGVRVPELGGLVAGRPLGRAVGMAVRSGFVEERGGEVLLTEAGRVRAASVVRTHRLWEHYLVSEAGMASDHVHGAAEQLEHVDVVPPGGVGVDPHGRRIPE